MKIGLGKTWHLLLWTQSEANSY